jgi:hypothetical protein
LSKTLTFAALVLEDLGFCYLFQKGCHITKDSGDLEWVFGGYPACSDSTTACVRAMINRIMKAAIASIILIASALSQS